MARVGYSMELNPETTAKAMGYELHISRKHAREICKAINSMRTAKAKEFLERVVVLKQAVPYKRYKRNVGHKRGMAAGRYPQKAAREFLKLLRNAESNARYKGLEPENMRIAHISAKKGRVFHGAFPRAMGRATPKYHETVSIEMILDEVR
jgi:large subunit ribosomal protein L22